LFATLRRRFGVAGAALLSAAIFAIAHGYGVLGFGAVFWSGLLWAWAYERTGSLLPSMAAHAVDNLMATLSVILVLRASPRSRGVPPQGRPGRAPRALRRPRRAGRQPVRRPQAFRAAAPLRSSPRDRRRAEELGRAQGSLDALAREAAGRSRRRPPHRIRGFRGPHPRRDRKSVGAGKSGDLGG